MSLLKRNLTTTILHVDGMKCIHCKQRVEDTLKKHKVQAIANLDSKNVSISFDESKISLDSIREIIEDLGFECK